ncbi:hypothetical protein FB451DRAFT_1171738 [Mycena latifolia]|nr:hypothetical protein FB451DRAFT_1171738 [Mycena latifolia]
MAKKSNSVFVEAQNTGFSPSAERVFCEPKFFGCCRIDLKDGHAVPLALQNAQSRVRDRPKPRSMRRVGRHVFHDILKKDGETPKSGSSDAADAVPDSAAASRAVDPHMSLSPSGYDAASRRTRDSNMGRQWRWEGRKVAGKWRTALYAGPMQSPTGKGLGEKCSLPTRHQSSGRVSSQGPSFPIRHAGRVLYILGSGCRATESVWIYLRKIGASNMADPRKQNLGRRPNRSTDPGPAFMDDKRLPAAL